MDMEAGCANTTPSEWEVHKGENEKILKMEKEKCKKTFYFKISVLVSVFFNLFPFITLVFLNFFIYKSVKRKGQMLPWSATRAKRELFIATVLILIILVIWRILLTWLYNRTLMLLQVYAVCHSFKSFLNLIELLELGTGMKLWGEKMNVVVAISHFCITFNSSVNFAIYCSKERCHFNKSMFRKHVYVY